MYVPLEPRPIYFVTSYIQKVINAFLEKITGVQSTPAGDCLFQVCPPTEATVLPEKQANTFHHTTAQLLFLSRIRRDIQMTVAFLTTRVKHPDNNDWGKLKKVLKYLNSTCFLRLTLFAKSLSNIIWYVDASHQLHDDCKGHTGSILTFGRGATIQVHPPNTKSHPKVLAKARLSDFTTRSVISSGLVNSSKLRSFLNQNEHCVSGQYEYTLFGEE